MKYMAVYTVLGAKEENTVYAKKFIHVLIIKGIVVVIGFVSSFALAIRSGTLLSRDILGFAWYPFYISLALGGVYSFYTKTSISFFAYHTGKDAITREITGIITVLMILSLFAAIQHHII